LQFLEVIFEILERFHAIDTIDQNGCIAAFEIKIKDRSVSFLAEGVVVIVSCLFFIDREAVDDHCLRALVNIIAVSVSSEKFGLACLAHTKNYHFVARRYGGLVVEETRDFHYD
jgi:hypothetical protein